MGSPRVMVDVPVSDSMGDCVVETVTLTVGKAEGVKEEDTVGVEVVNSESVDVMLSSGLKEIVPLLLALEEGS